MRLPVFQMAYAFDNAGRPGLVFPSEMEDELYPSIAFAIPILLPYKPFWGIVDYLEKNQFYFPAVVNGIYIEIEAQLEFPNLVFNINGYKSTITFNVVIPPFFPPPQISKENLYTYYTGALPTFRNIPFLEISPVSILAMNDLYTDNNITFVGYTPNFGEISLNYFNNQNG